MSNWRANTQSADYKGPFWGTVENFVNSRSRERKMTLPPNPPLAIRPIQAIIGLMKTEVRIAEFKGNVSKYLRADRLEVRYPTKSWKDIDKVFDKLPPLKNPRPGAADEALQWTRRDIWDKGLV